MENGSGVISRLQTHQEPIVWSSCRKKGRVTSGRRNVRAAGQRERNAALSPWSPALRRGHVCSVTCQKQVHAKWALSPSGGTCARVETRLRRAHDISAVTSKCGAGYCSLARSINNTVGAMTTCQAARKALWPVMQKDDVSASRSLPASVRPVGTSKEHLSRVTASTEMTRYRIVGPPGV